jgi:hypothetical protein
VFENGRQARKPASRAATACGRAGSARIAEAAVAASPAVEGRCHHHTATMPTNGPTQ